MAMNKARRTANLNNILTYDTLGNSTLVANLTVEGLTGAGFVKADANGLLSVDTAAYTVVTGATNYLTKITAPNTLGQSLVYDNGTSVYVNSTTGVTGYNHSFTVVANTAGGMVVSTTNTASAIGIVNSASGNKTWDISPFNNTLVINESGVATSMVFHPGGNITVGDITTTGHRFEVVGSFRTTGNNTLSQLQGVGNRMVVADTNGLLSTQAIPSSTGSVTSVSGTGGYGGLTLTGTVTTSGSLTLGGTPTGTWPISVTGNAATVTIANTNVNASYYIPLVSSTGNMSLLIDGGNDLNYNPFTNVFTIGGSIVINSVVINGGTASQFMKANGTLDNNTYLTGTGTAGQVTFWNGTSVQSGSNNLFWDNTNARLGVGSSTFYTTGAGWWGASAQEQRIFLKSTTTAKFTSLVLAGGLSGAGGSAIQFLDYNGTPVADFGTADGSEIGFAARQNTANINFYTTPSGTSPTRRMSVMASGNVLIQAGGTFTDSGERLQVTGDVKIVGTGTTVSTTALRVLNSAGNTSFIVYDDRSISTPSSIWFGFNKAISVGASSAGAINCVFGTSGDHLTSLGNIFSTQNTTAATSGTKSLWNFAQTINPTSGTAIFTVTQINPTINQTGGANGVTRGLYINPTLTAAADWRAIEVSAGVSVVAPSTTTSASLRIPSGTAPTTPIEGDIWATTTDLVARVNGVSYSLINSGLTGSGANGQVTFWNAASGITGSNNLFWDNTNGRLGVGTNTPAYRLDIAADTINTGIKITSNSGNAAVIDFFSTTTNLGSFLCTGATLSFGTYQSSQVSLVSASSGGVALRTSNSANAHIRFYAGNADSSLSNEVARIVSTNGNLILQNGGTFTDGGQRLQVTGDTLLKGSGNTSATTALLVENSDGSDLLTILNNGYTRYGNAGNNAFRVYPSSVASAGDVDLSGLFLTLNSRTSATETGTSAGFVHINGIVANSTTGIQNVLSIQKGFAPTSGTAVHNSLIINPNINQTGGANGGTRGLYVNPTLTAAADWRSIEWSNNTGWGLCGVGTANNYLGGSLGIGTVVGLADSALRVAKNMTGGTTYTSIYNDGTIQTDVTTSAIYFRTQARTAASVATTNVVHYYAQSLSLGAGSTVTNQFGFHADNNLIGATNNYGFYGNIASGSGRWNLYMNGTAANYLGGTLQVVGAAQFQTDISFGTDVARARILAGSGTNRGIIIQDNAGGTASVATLTIGNSTATNGGKNDLLLNNNFTGGAASAYTKFLLTGTFTESAGGGITRAIYINTTIGTTNNYRAIEWSNNNGWGLYGIGTAANYLGGALTVNNQITAGNAQATAGSAVLRSTYSSGNISNIGTNGSSGGMSINYAVYPASTSTADAYLSGVGTLSFPRSSYIVQADHRWLSAAAAIVAEGSAVTMTENMRLYNSGNLVIQNGGTYADAGQRLQVYGDTLMKGAGNTSGTTALTVQNSDATNIFRVRNDGAVLLGAALTYTNVGSRAIFTTADEMRFSRTAAATDTSGTKDFFQILTSFSPTSGTAQYNFLLINNGVNQTGGASGITRGLFVNPNLTAAADWRSIEWSNNSGWGLYGAGTASNYLGGSLGIAITPTSRLHVAGVGSDNTTNSLIVQNSAASVGLRVADSGDVYAGDGAWFRVQGFSKRYIYKTDVTDGIFSVSSCSSLGTSINMYGATHASKPRTIEIGATYAPTSGTIAYNALEMRPTVNQSSTASGTTRGLYVNPIISSAISQSTWRSIEWSNDAGYGLLGTGTAQNLLNGKLTVSVSVASANLSNTANTISLFGAQTLNIPAATIGTPGVVYAAGTSANYMRFNGNTTMNGDALFAGKAVINSLQFDTTGTVTMSNGGAGGGRALSGLQVQMQFAGATSGTVTKGASILIQGVYPNNTAGTVTFTEYYGLRINDLLEWDTGTGAGKIAMTNKWGIFQTGADDRNYFNGLMLLGSTTSTGERLQVNGTMKVTGATTISSTVKLSGLPTSATGLTAGDIWNNAGVLNIV